MKLIINPTKLTEVLAKDPNLASAVARVLEDSASRPQYRSTGNALLNAGVAIKVQSPVDPDPIFP